MSLVRGALRGLSILAVADHSDSLERLIQLLEPVGAIVIGVRTPNAAMEYAAAARFDAVLVDVRPDAGLRLLNELRDSRTASANTPVFAVCGERHDDRYRESGFAGWFLKPITGALLVARLAALPRPSWTDFAENRS